MPVLLGCAVERRGGGPMDDFSKAGVTSVFLRPPILIIEDVLSYKTFQTIYIYTQQRTRVPQYTESKEQRKQSSSGFHRKNYRA